MHNPIEQINDRTRTCADRLRSLPGEMPPPYNWQEFKRRASRSLPESRERLDWRPMAAAAALLLVVCGIAVWARHWGDERSPLIQAGTPGASLGRPRVGVDTERPGNGGERVAQAATRAGTDAAGRAGVDAASRAGLATANENSLAAVGATSEAALAALRSRAIDSWLAALPREPVVVHVGTRAAAARLEDRIAQVDDLLTSASLEGTRPDRLAALQRERVRLVGSLAQVRYAEVVASEYP